MKVKSLNFSNNWIYFKISRNIKIIGTLFKFLWLFLNLKKFSLRKLMIILLGIISQGFSKNMERIKTNKPTSFYLIRTFKEL